MKKVNTAISALFILVMIIAVWVWAVSVHTWTLAGALASLLCLALFIWTGLRAIPAITGYINSPSALRTVNTDDSPEERQRIWWKIVLWVIASRVLLILAAYVFWVLREEAPAACSPASLRCGISAELMRCLIWALPSGGM